MYIYIDIYIDIYVYVYIFEKRGMRDNYFIIFTYFL